MKITMMMPSRMQVGDGAENPNGRKQKKINGVRTGSELDREFIVTLKHLYFILFYDHSDLIWKVLG
jgi:hypothetical protein